MKATFASLHIEDNAAKWLQVYKRQYGLADWQSFIDAVVEKFGASDYRDAMEELLDLTQTSTVEQYATAFENLKYEICMHNEGFGELFFVSQFVKGLKCEIGAVVQSQQAGRTTKRPVCGVGGARCVTCSLVPHDSLTPLE